MPTPQGWSYSSGGNNDSERYSIRGDESIEVPPEVITALTGVLPNFPRTDVNGESGLTGSFAAALVWSLLWGDEDSCSSILFNEIKLTLESKATLLGLLLSAIESKQVVVETTASVEKLVLQWRAHLKTLDAAGLKDFKIRPTLFEPCEPDDPAVTLSASIVAASNITVADLRGTNGFYDVAAILEVALSDRVTRASRAAAGASFNLTWRCAYAAAAPVGGGAALDADAMAGLMADRLHTTTWPSGLNPTLTSSRSIAADFRLRMSGNHRDARIATAIEAHVLHVITFYPAVASVLMVGDKLPLGRAESISALLVAIAALNLENRMPPETHVSLGMFKRLETMWARCAPYINSPEVQAMEPQARIDGLRDSRAAANLSADTGAALVASSPASKGAGAENVAPGIRAAYREQGAEVLNSQLILDVVSAIEKIEEAGGPHQDRKILETALLGGPATVSAPPRAPPRPCANA
jgi:hypothetical protein